MFVVLGERSSRKIVVGRNILATPRVKDIVDATGLKLETKNTADGSIVLLEVNPVEKDRWDITVGDIQCPGVDHPKVIGELISLLNRYRTAIALNMRDLGAAKGTKNEN